MFFQEWNVLLVDDEPDVLIVSTLAMKHFEVYGIPVKLYAANNKAEAINFLQETPGVAWSLALAFIDVVMETDTAGLELCQFLREYTQNKLTQLYIRTGQPGIAPEREVIDRYDINGYFTKLEATEDKLYSLTKSAVRQFLWSSYSMATMQFLNGLIAAGNSRAQLAQSIQQNYDMLVGMTQDLDALATSGFYGCMLVDDEFVGGIGIDADKARAECQRLEQLPGTDISPDGDKYVQEGNNLLIKVGSLDTNAYALFHTTFQAPEYTTLMIYQVLIGLATAWSRAS